MNDQNNELLFRGCCFPSSTRVRIGLGQAKIKIQKSISQRHHESNYKFDKVKGEKLRPLRLFDNSISSQSAYFTRPDTSSGFVTLLKRVEYSRKLVESQSGYWSLGIGHLSLADRVSTRKKPMTNNQ
jgi:hypothetical protein